MFAVTCLLTLSILLTGAPRVTTASAPDRAERYHDKELAVELYGLLQNCLMESGPSSPVRGPGAKRNSELINSLLGIGNMLDAGRR